MKRIAGAERIDRCYVEHRQTMQLAAIQINDVVGSVADGKERVGLVGDAQQALAEIGDTGGLPQAFPRKHDV